MTACRSEDNAAARGNWDFRMLFNSKHPFKKYQRNPANCTEHSLALNALLILQGCSRVGFGFASEEELNAMSSVHGAQKHLLCQGKSTGYKSIWVKDRGFW